MPIGAVIGRADVMDKTTKGTLGGTYLGNPVACAAALATIGYMKKIRIAEKGKRVGRTVMKFFADKIATKSPLGLRCMKTLVDDGLQQPLDTALRLELLASEVHSHSADLHEGLAAFNEKRTPRFTGH